MKDVNEKSQPRDAQGRFAEKNRINFPQTDAVAGQHEAAIGPGEELLAGAPSQGGDGRIWSFANIDGEPISVIQSQDGFYAVTNHGREYEGTGVTEKNDGIDTHIEHGHYEVDGTDDTINRIVMMENTCDKCATTSTKEEVLSKLAASGDSTRVMVTTGHDGKLTILPTTDSGGNVISDAKLSEGYPRDTNSTPSFTTRKRLSRALDVMNDDAPISVGTDHTNGIVLMQDKDLPNGDPATVGVAINGQHEQARTVWPSKWTDEQSLPPVERHTMTYADLTKRGRTHYLNGDANRSEMLPGEIAFDNPRLMKSKRWYTKGEGTVGVDGVFEIALPERGSGDGATVINKRNGERRRYDNLDEAIEGAASLY